VVAVSPATTVAGDGLTVRVYPAPMLKVQPLSVIALASVTLMEKLREAVGCRLPLQWRC
jgi:hypothetical protein